MTEPTHYLPPYHQIAGFLESFVAGKQWYPLESAVGAFLASHEGKRKPWKQKLPEYSKCIESVVLGTFKTNYVVCNKNDVVFNKEILIAYSSFLEDKWALEGLALLPELNGKKFSELSYTVATTIENRSVCVLKLKPLTDKALGDFLRHLEVKAGLK